ncbi:hypothetical protein HN681_04710 [archaeon]|jgi:hypothetical protein|nr:hypothetical protein [archaeon]MBT3731009.1 hypothetical protein [archaeon]MBT4669753.1 hypothetical protein [archaeon]MBT5029903.1 hypothetical protein [archaeon]MBT5288475.1 hypothetical protein [archaeon]
MIIKEYQTLDSFFYEEIPRCLSQRNVRVSENTEWYLTNLLSNCRNRLLSEKEGFESVTLLQEKSLSEPSLSKRIGDQCLIWVGIFYDYIERIGNGQINYHCSVGSLSYDRFANLARQGQDALRDTYLELAENFKDIGEALRMIDIPKNLSSKQIIDTLERYHKEGKIRDLLILQTNGINPQQVQNVIA